MVFNEVVMKMNKQMMLAAGALIIVLVVVLGYSNRSSLSGLYSTTPKQNDAMSGSNTEKGKFLTAENGMTLYVFDKDKAGVSNCYDSCATAWPPYLASGNGSNAAMPAGLTEISRKDGSKQYAYHDMPLYFYAGDGKAGDTTGDGVNGIWHLIKQ